MREIETIDSRIAYQNKWMTVREERVRRASGAEGIFGIVDKPDFTAILPIEDGCIQLVEQYRYPVKGRFWEIPQGSWEGDPNADQLAVARGELREETGLVAKEIRHIGHIYQAYGYSNQGFHLFIATGFDTAKQDLDLEEEGLVTKKFSINDFETMIASGVIKDATTISAYGYAKLKGIV